MSRKISMMKSIVVAVALVAGVSGMARADDSSMNPFTGDSYAYFNRGDLPQNGNPVFDKAASAWRQSNPHGLSERQLEALSSEAPEWQPAPVIDKAPSSFRLSHPNGLSERELQALSSEAPAWHSPTSSFTSAVASTNEAAFAQHAAK